MLLIDDVFTTASATASACSAELRESRSRRGSGAVGRSREAVANFPFNCKARVSGPRLLQDADGKNFAHDHPAVVVRCLLAERDDSTVAA